MTSDEAAEKWLEVHAEVEQLVRSRRFGEVCAILQKRREEAVARSENELGSALSTFLATFLTIEKRTDEALRAAQTAEELDPTSIDAKLSVVWILLDYLEEPERALAKAEEAVQQLGPDDPMRYKALALLGTARARTGDFNGAVAVFEEMTSQPSLESLKAANYPGVFDLRLVTELVKSGVATEKCRRYLQTIKEIPNSWPHLQQQLNELLAQLGGV